MVGNRLTELPGIRGWEAGIQHSKKTKDQASLEMIDAMLDVAERMIGTDAVLDTEKMKQRELIVGLATQDCSPEIVRRD